jgi:hypothetical protein
MTAATVMALVLVRHGNGMKGGLKGDTGVKGCYNSA